MPVQINEVVIKAVVDNSPQSSNAGNTTTGQPANQPIPEAEIAALVLEIIKEKNER